MNQVTYAPGMKLADLEKAAILKAFEFYQRNKTITANSLGIAIRTLDAKLQKYGEEDTAETERQARLKSEREKFIDLQRHGRPQPATVVTSAPAPSKQVGPPVVAETPRTMARK